MWGDPDADYEKVGALQAELEDKINASDAWNLERNVEIAMDALRCPPNDADVTTLSGGERRRVALCRLLLSHPDLLLLDEPTNHLDAESVDWLERFLQEYPGTVVAITHDRYFLDNVARWILELDRGRGFPFEGNYSGWLEQKQARLAHEEKQASARQRTLQRELEWVRMAPKARQAKGRARLTAYEKLQAEAEADAGRGDRLEIVHPARAPARRHRDRGGAPGQGLRRPAPHRGPLLHACPRPASSASSARTAPARPRCSACSPAQEQPDGGTVKVGDTVELAYVDQSRDTLDADKHRLRGDHRRQDHFKVGNREMHGRAYVAGFNFKGSDQQKRVGDLSGGERNRVHLAKLLRDRRQRPAARRAHQRPRRRHAAGPGGRRSRRSPAARWSSATTAGSSTGSAPTCWPSRATRRCAGSRATSPSTRRYRHKELGADADTPHRIKYKPMARCRSASSASSCRHLRRRDRGMIVASVAGNNNGGVVTFGLLTAARCGADGGLGRRRPHRAGAADEELAEQVEDASRLVEPAPTRPTVRDLCATPCGSGGADDRRGRPRPRRPPGHRGRRAAGDAAARSGRRAPLAGDGRGRRRGPPLPGPRRWPTPGPTTPSCPRRGATARTACPHNRVWIVDPLDGTNEFGEDGRADWAVHVALVRRRLAGRRRPSPCRRSARRSPPSPPRRCRRRRRPARRGRHEPLAPSPRRRGDRARRSAAEFLRLGGAGAKAMAVVTRPRRHLRPRRRHVRVGLARRRRRWRRRPGCHVSRSTVRRCVYNQPRPVAARPPGVPSGAGRTGAGRPLGLTLVELTSWS